jgi:hypothetical protein
LPTVAQWPNGAQAALSFSFDWETAMGGLIHSRSSDDPNSDQNPVARGLRMRQGITTTLDIFRPYGIRATYYANGYNFLLGNIERRTFMGNPTFAWAKTEDPYSWRSDIWTKTPWFALDPHGTVQSDPAWYFGDLIPLLQRERQDIQSHTFSHLYGGFANAAEWRADLAAWSSVAAERGVPPARSLAFPWSSSAGMSDANWQALADAGITSVTRTNWSPKQPQYHIVSAQNPHCAPVPGHETILACPDFYLTTSSAPQALKLIDTIIGANGMLDLWAHTEEVTAPDQIAVWRQVVGYAAQKRDAGKLWIAPLAEIAAWQQARDKVRVETREPKTDSQGLDGAMNFQLSNSSTLDLKGLTLVLPFAAQRVEITDSSGAVQSVRPITKAGDAADSRFSVRGSMLLLDIKAGQQLEVTAWPA